MAIGPINYSAPLGIQRGLHGMHRAALNMVQPATGPDAEGGDFARSMVEMKQHAVQAKASTRALGAYHETMGTLLDIRA